MTPATVFQCTSPYCLGQVPTAPPGQSADSPAISAYDSMAMILDSTCMLPSIKDLLAEIQSSRRHAGRKGYSVVSMFRAFLSKFLLGRESTQAFLRELKRSAGLRTVCGLVSDVPHKSTFSRFFARVAENAAALEDAQAELVRAIWKYLPGLGLKLAIDGTDISAYANLKRQAEKIPREQRTDRDAEWGYRTPKSKYGGVSKKKGEKKGDDHDDKYCGYRVHMICDIETGLPMGYTFHPADVSESTELPIVLDKVLDTHADWLRPHYLLADKGYDGEPNNDACMKRGIVPIVDIKNPASRGATKHPNRHKGGLYAPDGSPTCPDSEHTPMEYIRTVREPDGEIYHEYRCNPNGCPLKSRSSGAMLYCDSREVHRERVQEGNYRVQGPVARASHLWAELMPERVEIERLFSRLKGSRSLESLTYRGFPKVRAHVGLSVLAYLGTALGRVNADNMDGIRTMTLEDEF